MKSASKRLYECFIPIRRSKQSSQKVLRLEMLLESLGVKEAEQVVFDAPGKRGLGFYASDRRRVAFLGRQLQEFSFKLKCTQLEDVDWRDKWKESYKPFKLGKKFFVIPAWEKHGLSPKSRIPIFLDPGSAFGTGMHETTKLMVRLLEGVGEMQDFLDIGTGSGILSMVAEKLGAKHIEAFDLDEPSVGFAKKNFKRNTKDSAKFQASTIHNFKSPNKFLAVGANVRSGVLLEHQKLFSEWIKPGGLFLASGVMKRDESHFKKNFKPKDLRRMKTIYGRHWCGFLYRKKKAVSPNAS